MSKCIDSISQVLKKRGSNWEIITPNAILRQFLDGDYQFWVTARGRCGDILECSGGNLHNWEVVGDEIHLSCQYLNGDEICRIQNTVLWEVIERLAISRHLREKFAEAEKRWAEHHAAWTQDPSSCTRGCQHSLWDQHRELRAAMQAKDIPFSFIEEN